jgi:tRNA(fMet)-specific endonuclease VapC
MKHLLDTNVISELVTKQPNSRVVRWVDSLNPEEAYLSVITIGELSKGIEKLPASRRKQTLHEWLRNDLLLRFSGRILMLDVEAMLTWGNLMGQWERAGKPMPAMDSLIAALALHHDCSLATRNVDHFRHTGVTLVNPWQMGE